MEPAAPNADPRLLRPKYNPIADFPPVKRMAVRSPPTQTSFQSMRTSGTALKIDANRRTTIAKETPPSSICQSQLAPGSRDLKYSLPADSAALNTREISSRKPTPSIIANESRRSFRKPFQKCPGVGFTPQIWFIEL